MTSKEQLLFGERIRSRRNILNFTQEYVAEKVDITSRYYQALERGEKSPSLNTLMRLSKTLNISMDYLLLGDLSYSLKNPLVDILNGLSQQQREDSLIMLKIYAKACRG